MKFVRHLTAVVLVVAVIVGVGMLWAHASGGSAGIGAGPRVPPPEALLRLKHIKGGVIGARPVTGFHLSPFDLAETGNLIRTCMIEAALAAVVITVSAIRRWRRRTRRIAAQA